MNSQNARFAHIPIRSINKMPNVFLRIIFLAIYANIENPKEACNA